MDISRIDQLAFGTYATYISGIIASVWLIIRLRRQDRLAGVVTLITGGVAATVTTWMSSRYWGTSGQGVIGLRLRDLTQHLLRISIPMLIGSILMAFAFLCVRWLLHKNYQAAGIVLPSVVISLVFFTTTPTLKRWTEQNRPVAADPMSGGIQILEGFTVEIIPTVGISNPTSLAFDSNGDLYLATYGGPIWVIPAREGRLQPNEARIFAQGYKVPVGLAWQEETLYISSHGKITAVRDTDQDGTADWSKEIVSGLPARLYPWHVNNDLTVGPDGRLYIAVGSTSDASVETSQYAASILAIDPETGDIEVFATGVRNPFDLAFNQHGDLFATDNGPDGLDTIPGDEFNLILEGQDYGFPYYFNYPPPGSGSQPPLVVFPAHASADGFIFYTGQAFPSEYQGNAFVALFNRGEIARIELERMEDGEYLARTEIFASGFINPLDLAEANDGVLYLVDFTTSGLYRLDASNLP